MIRGQIRQATSISCQDPPIHRRRIADLIADASRSLHNSARARSCGKLAVMTKAASAAGFDWDFSVPGTVTLPASDIEDGSRSTANSSPMPCVRMASDLSLDFVVFLRGSLSIESLSKGSSEGYCDLSGIVVCSGEMGTQVVPPRVTPLPADLIASAAFPSIFPSSSVTTEMDGGKSDTETSAALHTRVVGMEVLPASICVAALPDGFAVLGVVACAFDLPRSLLGLVEDLSPSFSTVEPHEKARCDGFVTVRSHPAYFAVEYDVRTGKWKSIRPPLAQATCRVPESCAPSCEYSGSVTFYLPSDGGAGDVVIHGGIRKMSGRAAASLQHAPLGTRPMESGPNELLLRTCRTVSLSSGTWLTVPGWAPALAHHTASTVHSFASTASGRVLPPSEYVAAGGLGTAYVFGGRGINDDGCESIFAESASASARLSVIEPISSEAIDLFKDSYLTPAPSRRSQRLSPENHALRRRDASIPSYRPKSHSGIVADRKRPALLDLTDIRYRSAVALKSRVWRVTHRGWASVVTVGDGPSPRECASSAIIPLSRGFGFCILGGREAASKVTFASPTTKETDTALDFSSLVPCPANEFFILSLSTHVWTHIVLRESINQVSARSTSLMVECGSVVFAKSQMHSPSSPLLVSGAAEAVAKAALPAPLVGSSATMEWEGVPTTDDKTEARTILEAVNKKPERVKLNVFSHTLDDLFLSIAGTGRYLSLASLSGYTACHTSVADELAQQFFYKSGGIRVISARKIDELSAKLHDTSEKNARLAAKKQALIGYADAPKRRGRRSQVDKAQAEQGDSTGSCLARLYDNDALEKKRRALVEKYTSQKPSCQWCKNLHGKAASKEVISTMIDRLYNADQRNTKRDLLLKKYISSKAPNRTLSRSEFDGMLERVYNMPQLESRRAALIKKYVKKHEEENSLSAEAYKTMMERLYNPEHWRTRHGLLLKKYLDAPKCGDCVQNPSSLPSHLVDELIERIYYSRIGRERVSSVPTGTKASSVAGSAAACVAARRRSANASAGSKPTSLHPIVSNSFDKAELSVMAYSLLVCEPGFFPAFNNLDVEGVKFRATCNISPLASDGSAPSESNPYASDIPFEKALDYCFEIYDSSILLPSIGIDAMERVGEPGTFFSRVFHETFEKAVAFLASYDFAGRQHPLSDRPDLIAALMLYCADVDPPQYSIFRLLPWYGAHDTRRMDRWTPLLHGVQTALLQLPALPISTFYRAVRLKGLTSRCDESSNEDNSQGSFTSVKVGQLICFSTLLSAITVENVARMMMLESTDGSDEDSFLMLHIHTAFARDVTAVCYLGEDEREVMIPAATPFRIVDVQHADGGSLSTLKMEDIAFQ